MHTHLTNRNSPPIATATPPEPAHLALGARLREDDLVVCLGAEVLLLVRRARTYPTAFLARPQAIADLALCPHIYR